MKCAYRLLVRTLQYISLFSSFFFEFFLGIKYMHAYPYTVYVMVWYLSTVYVVLSMLAMVTAGLEWPELYILVCDRRRFFCEWTWYRVGSHLLTSGCHCIAQLGPAGVNCTLDVLKIFAHGWLGILKVALLQLSLITLHPLLCVDAGLDIRNPHDITHNFDPISPFKNLTKQVNHTQSVCMCGWAGNSGCGCTFFVFFFSLARQYFSQSAIQWTGNFWAWHECQCLPLYLVWTYN